MLHPSQVVKQSFVSYGGRSQWCHPFVVWWRASPSADRYNDFTNRSWTWALLEVKHCHQWVSVDFCCCRGCKSQLMFCDVDLWYISWQRTRTLSATNLTTILIILKSARFEFVLFSKRFCTRLCFVLSFVFTYGGTEDFSLRLPCGVTLNFLGFASLC